MDKFISILFEDVSIASSLIQIEDNQYNRRSYIRAAIAAVEGLTFTLKQHVMETSDFNNNGLFSDAERALLKEESYTLNNRAEATVRSNYLPTADNYRFALSMYLRNSSTYKLDLSDGGWENFNKALKIRHRIAHPKSTKDYIVSDEDMGIFRSGYNWFQFVSVSALLDTNNFLKNQLEILESGFEEGDNIR